MHFGQDGVNGLLNGFQSDLAGFAFVGARFVFHGGRAVLVVAVLPGFDGAPFELARVALLVGEGHLADGLDAIADAVALGHVDGAQHAHFQVRSRIFHDALFGLSGPPPGAFCSERAGSFSVTVARLRRGGRGGGVPSRVVAGWENRNRTTRARQFGAEAETAGAVFGAGCRQWRRPAARISEVGRRIEQRWTVARKARQARRDAGWLGRGETAGEWAHSSSGR